MVIEKILSEEERKEILERIEASPSWSKVYNEAPSEACKERFMLDRVGFGPCDLETRRRIIPGYEELSKKYTLEDLRFLYKYSKPNPSRGLIISRYKKLGGDPKDLVLAEGRR